jgi:sterol desaturase/sphingolipid hydroxylase (fatty acid hydroxylase superfamily)
MLLKATPDSPRMFESDFVDLFSRTHPAIVPILYVPASTWLFWYSVSHAGVGVAATSALFVAGVLSWSLVEYWLHRTFFHWVPKGAWGDRMHFLVHGVHHKWPRDKYRLVMPPAVSITLFWVFLGLFLVTLGRTYTWGFHSGFVVGYMGYDLTHYYVHHFSPKTEYGRTLKKHHMLHHFKDHDSRFGVSSRLWDFVFGTATPSEH